MADSPPAALLFDIDGTLVSTGGASDRAWHRAFLELHSVEVNVPDYTGKGVPDPEVGLQCFRAVIGREPAGDEMAKLMALRQRYLAEEVESSPGYRVMPGVVELLERLTGEGRLVGLITGNTEPAAHTKLGRADLNRFFAFGGYGSDANQRVDVCRKALDRRGDRGRRQARPRRVDRHRRHAARHRGRARRGDPGGRGRDRGVRDRPAPRGWGGLGRARPDLVRAAVLAPQPTTTLPLNPWIVHVYL